ncbi:MAG: helix-turn-helix transcriptional regulator [Prevotella sp.]|nr:helix-turn-helix transcriptional regulator [Prevotella sp.]
MIPLHASDTGVLRFNELRRLMTDCSQKMLSQTLKNLELSHLVHRKVYLDKRLSQLFCLFLHHSQCPMING